MTTTTAAHPEAVRRKIESWLAEQGDDTVAMALRGRPEWFGEPALTVNGTTVRVVPCPTPLVARAAIHDLPAGERLVLLTELDDAELGDGVLAHLSKHTVRPIDPWDLVRQAFGVAFLDPTLVIHGSWVPRGIACAARRDGWPVPAGSVLTREHVLRHVSAELLGVDAGALDASGLLQWTTDATAQMAFLQLPADVVEGVSGYLTETVGAAGQPVMAVVRAGHGVDTVALGLLAGILWTADQRTAVAAAAARARLEPRFGGMRLTARQAEALNAAAESWIYRMFDGEDEGRHAALRVLHRAEEIAREIDMTTLLSSSTLLPSGFAQRLRQFADVVRVALPAGGAASAAPAAAVRRVQDAFAAVEAHRGAEAHRVEVARMATRLLRWLASPDGPPPATIDGAVRRHVGDDGWVDRARLDVFVGDRDPAVAEAYRLLHNAVDARRARHDEQFAAQLAAATAAEREPGGMLRVEDVLARVVEPILGTGRRVLLLVLDGMGVAGATELAESLSSAWVELTPDGGHRAGVLAALPTVTEVSRCSLFSGAIAVGQQQAERTAFARRFPHGLLLHKGGLRAGAGATLDGDVLAALADDAVPLVASVINTVDDALDRSTPDTVVWSKDTVASVRDLLAAAGDRVVVITSDHGHVIDRGPDSRVVPSPSSENRWRAVGGPLGPGEVAITGSRVAPDGAAVLLWREELRYGPRKAGYHGGAAPAEAVIPLLVFVAGETSVPGWEPGPVASPAWWRERLAIPGADVPPAGRAGRPPRAQPTQSEQLFDLVTATPQAAPRQRRDLADALLASDRYATRRDPRVPITDERVAAIVRALVDGGGRATLDTLAARAGVPAHRITGTITALRRLLQVEGYPVLTIDPDRHTVHLNQALLTEQFELEPR
ncbi:hypothetical protein Ais01nite_32570 [Asanoa ishikariensis]|uniref:PglZ domain-containing protein n=1 Tax=Asanoa ishikariensis TaxID=137265 RepID=A0A1H3UXG9_9ACTN|nr:BREX-2 system phosphatase PglZ [Asanoa ishikariensis]GIF65222.1 hypothetical protein Ais01nite_32570 [Asanoa ishikariensis]SDZ66681.1 PglZ domain-containing protein [Asanoa ishikariensis]